MFTLLNIPAIIPSVYCPAIKPFRSQNVYFWNCRHLLNLRFKKTKLESFKQSCSNTVIKSSKFVLSAEKTKIILNFVVQGNYQTLEKYSRDPLKISRLPKHFWFRCLLSIYFLPHELYPLSFQLSVAFLYLTFLLISAFFSY